MLGFGRVFATHEQVAYTTITTILRLLHPQQSTVENRWRRAEATKEAISSLMARKTSAFNAF